MYLFGNSIGLSVFGGSDYGAFSINGFLECSMQKQLNNSFTVNDIASEGFFVSCTSFNTAILLCGFQRVLVG